MLIYLLIMNPYHVPFVAMFLPLAACSTQKFQIWGTYLIYDLFNPSVPHHETLDHHVVPKSYTEKYVT